MANIGELPHPVKFYRESNGHNYVWDGCFTTPLYDLNDPALGIGAAINKMYGGDNLIQRTVAEEDDAYFETFQNFLLAGRLKLAQDIAAAVNA